MSVLATMDLLAICICNITEGQIWHVASQFSQSFVCRLIGAFRPDAHISLESDKNGSLPLLVDSFKSCSASVVRTVPTNTNGHRAVACVKYAFKEMLAFWPLSWRMKLASVQEAALARDAQHGNHSAMTNTILLELAVVILATSFVSSADSGALSYVTAADGCGN